MTPTPHDALFKATFANPARAAELLADILGPAIADRIDLAGLQVVPTSFIDAALRASQSDLLYATTFDGRPLRIYLLFEHRSSPEWFMALRLLQYVLLVWEGFLRDHPRARRLPAVLPVVLHHGEGGWRCPTDFADLIDLPTDAGEAIWSLVPRFRFALDDLGAADVAALRARALSACVLLPLLALLEGRSARPLADIVRGWKDLVRARRDAPDAAAELRLLLTYLSEVRDVAYDDFAALVRDIDPTLEDAMPSLAERLRDEGRQEGLLKGRQEAQKEHLDVMRQTVRVLLKTRFGEVPARMLRRVDDADLAVLQGLVVRAASVGTLAELLDG